LKQQKDGDLPQEIRLSAFTAQGCQRFKTELQSLMEDKTQLIKGTIWLSWDNPPSETNRNASWLGFGKGIHPHYQILKARQNIFSVHERQSIRLNREGVVLFMGLGFEENEPERAGQIRDWFEKLRIRKLKIKK
jgi:hypothetical protein